MMNNLLVTGGCGFIGANFIRYLMADEAFEGRVINVDKLTYAGNPESLADVQEAFGERYCFVQADICDEAAMATVFDEYSVDSVCHFAAESHVDRSIAGPEAFVETNIVGTFRLLELARKHQGQIKRFHHISTDEVFGSLGVEGAFCEDTPYRPNSPYSASKAAADHLVRAYRKTYELPVSISNCSNNYGPYQFPEKLIPLMILNALAGKPLPVYGDGRHIRDWLFVNDHCRAVWDIMRHGAAGETYNIGGGSELPNLEVVEMICDGVDALAGMTTAGPRRNLITFVTDRPGHDRRYAIDCTRLQQELGWRPQESFATGLEKTIQWYMDHPTWVARVQSGEYRRWIHQHYGY